MQLDGEFQRGEIVHPGAARISELTRSVMHEIPGNLCQWKWLGEAEQAVWLTNRSASLPAQAKNGLIKPVGTTLKDWLKKKWGNNAVWV